MEKENNIDWDYVERIIDEQEGYIDSDGNRRKEVFMGAVFPRTPDGRYGSTLFYDEEKFKELDEIEAEAKKRGLYIRINGDDSCDILIRKIL